MLESALRAARFVWLAMRLRSITLARAVVQTPDAERVTGQRERERRTAIYADPRQDDRENDQEDLKRGPGSGADR